MIGVKPFNTGLLFSGGGGMFIEYYDIVKPIYLYAIIKMIIMNNNFGLPLNIISSMSLYSLLEWYTRRKEINPLHSLDYKKLAKPEDLDNLLNEILKDDSIYKLCPALNIEKLLSSYKKQHMSFPVYVYNPEDNPIIKKDCEQVLYNTPVKFLHGDLEEVIKQNCDQNFTYIFSNIENVQKVAKFLSGSFSHILLAKDYRYNFKDYYKTYKYNLQELANKYPFARIGLTNAIDFEDLYIALKNLLIREK